ncbi:FecR domain-containing protein [Caulobacter sp. 602-1]|uniref:FecR family protein n=1 Tax=Caulobacter sp. 602-1 TaxID=2492472 RepID=UPI000F63F0AD|nr:FecR domain-containing protein [Caulobacter sp. 602-1]RRN63914.1 DUF4880 domain-containing protein [Caulobacter sp. 602-1]
MSPHHVPMSPDDINQMAAAWAARSDRGLTAAEEIALEAWLNADRRHAGAYLRMNAVMVSGEVAAAGAGPAPLRLPNRRQGLLAGAGLLAASVAAASVFAAFRQPKRFNTAKGQKQVVTLEDGSVVTLNTATRLEISFSRDRRLVRLEDGEALFDVAKDETRPFIVRAADTDVRAVGTSFTVSRLAGSPIEVLVREGVVEVKRPRIATNAPMRVAANTRAVIAEASATPLIVAKVEPDQISRELAWQQGRLVFAGESLSAAVAQFARYSDTQIVVTDADLAGRGVAGVFDASDPVGFAQAVALSLNAHAEIGRDQVRISR